MTFDAAKLAELDQLHAAAMTDLDAVVATVREYVKQYGTLAATAIVAKTLDAAMEAGETLDLLAIAAQAITRLAELTTGQEA